MTKIISRTRRHHRYRSLRGITIKAEDFEDDEENISLIDPEDEETAADEKIRANTSGIGLKEMGKGGEIKLTKASSIT